MQTIFKRSGIVAIALVVMLLPILACAKSFVVGIEPAFPPWAFVENGEYKGIAPDAMRAMAEQQGFDIEFKSLTFSSLIPALRADKIDILATGLTVSKKRAEKIAFTVPWWEVTLDALVKKDSNRNLVTALCCGAKIGAQSGSTDYDWLKNNLIDNGIDINVRTYPSATVAVHDVEIGRLDAYFLDDNTARKFLHERGEGIRLAGSIVPYPPEVYALGVRQGDTQLLALLNAAQVQLYESGQWAKIIHKYLPDVQVGKVPGPMPDGIPSYEKPVPGLAQ